MPAEKYVATYLMPIITKAVNEGNSSMIFGNIPYHTIIFGFNNLTDVKKIMMNYLTAADGCIFSQIKTGKSFRVPQYHNIAKYFETLGHELHIDDTKYGFCIMDLSKFTKTSIVLQPEPLTVETYITKYLKPLIDEADKKGKRTLICRHSEHTVHYKFNHEDNYERYYIGGNLYGYKEKMGGYYRKNWNKLETDKDFYIPDHKDIATKFKELGYDLLLVDEKCFIINWSQMVKAETSVGIVQQNNSRGVAAGIAAYQELLKNKIKADLPAILGDFFYSAIVQSVTAQEAIEIHFIHSVPGRVKCIKPPAKEFLNLTIVLNLLLDQRHVLGYEIAFRTNEDQQTLIVMTFPLNASQKLISNLQ